jgi:hypothetical protein
MINIASIFIYNPKRRRFLFIQNIQNTGSSINGGTGIIKQRTDKDYSMKNLLPEVEKRIGIQPIELLSLDWGSVYLSGREEIKEMFFLAFLNSDRSIKDLEFKWLDLNNFIEEIDLEENKELLRRVLTKAVKKEVYFNKKERGQ